MSDSYAMPHTEQASHSQPSPDSRYSPIPDHEDPLLEGPQSLADYSSYDETNAQYAQLTAVNQMPVAYSAAHSPSIQVTPPQDYLHDMQYEAMIDMPQSQRAISRERRKAQNRAAQKAFRTRKESRIKVLEDRLERQQKDFTALQEAYDLVSEEKKAISAELETLRAENVSLRSAPSSSASVNEDPWQGFEQGWEGQLFAQYENLEDFPPLTEDPPSSTSGTQSMGDSFWTEEYR